MRLWHKDLIPYLPRQQLLGQWRECCAIASNIINKGTPNHMLVNKIMDYPLEHFKSYTYLIYEELWSRGYQPNILNFKLPSMILEDPLPKEKLFPDWHNDIYFMQCYFNLMEKYDCGGMTKEEWDKIEQCFFLNRTPSITSNSDPSIQFRPAQVPHTQRKPINSSIQALLQEFIDSGLDSAEVLLCSDGYADVQSFYGCLHSGIKCSQLPVKVFKCQGHIYLINTTGGNNNV